MRVNILVMRSAIFAAFGLAAVLIGKPVAAITAHCLADGLAQYKDWYNHNDNDDTNTKWLRKYWLSDTSDKDSKPHNTLQYWYQDDTGYGVLNAPNLNNHMTSPVYLNLMKDSEQKWLINNGVEFNNWAVATSQTKSKDIHPPKPIIGARGTFTPMTDLKINGKHADLPKCTRKILDKQFGIDVDENDILIGGHGSGSFAGLFGKSGSKGCTDMDTNDGNNYANCMNVCQMFCCLNEACMFARVERDSDSSSEYYGLETSTTITYRCKMYAFGAYASSDNDYSTCMMVPTAVSNASDATVTPVNIWDDQPRRNTCDAIVTAALGSKIDTGTYGYMDLLTCDTAQVGASRRQLSSAAAAPSSKKKSPKKYKPGFMTGHPSPAKILKFLNDFKQTFRAFMAELPKYLNEHPDCKNNAVPELLKAINATKQHCPIPLPDFNATM